MLKVKKEITYKLDGLNLEQFVKEEYGITYNFRESQRLPCNFNYIGYQLFPVFNAELAEITQKRIDAIRQDKVVPYRGTIDLLYMLVQDGHLEPGNIVVEYH